MGDTPAAGNTVETRLTFTPKFDANGLITAVVTDGTTGAVLMVAHMNAEAITRSLDTGEAHFWSRSRAALWRKGETSGHILKIREMRTDCDQDAIWIIADPLGPTCHTGETSCFYRVFEPPQGSAGAPALLRSPLPVSSR